MILHLDLSTGASGDKLLGALLALGESLERVRFEELQELAGKLLPHVSFEREQVVRGGVAATQISVKEERVHAHSNGNHHSHTPHRHWGEIRDLIEHAATQGFVDTATATLAIKVFTRVAKAEARVHGVAPDEVHFHEVGAADSIIDIVFNSLLFTRLAPTAVYATPLALGSGTFVCNHGELPVPAPATAEILAQSTVPVYASSHTGELTTPTGAALIAECVTSFAPLPCSRPLSLGYGAGSREIAGAPNVLRALGAEVFSLTGLKESQAQQLTIEGVVRLECNLDHLTAEAAAFACEELLNKGALDVWQESITMKKGRLASKVVVLSRPEQATELTQSIIEFTGSLGVRSLYQERTVIPRTLLVLETPYGPVPFKAAEVGAPSNRTHWMRPEHDAVASLARELGLPYLSLYADLQSFAEAERQAQS